MSVKSPTGAQEAYQWAHPQKECLSVSHSYQVLMEKKLNIPTKMWNWTRLSTLSTSINRVLEILAKAIWQEEEIKMDKMEMKVQVSLFEDDKFLCKKKP